MKEHQHGFTLMELMATVAIIGILSAIAIPQYSQYVLRTRLAEAYTALAGVQPALEQYWDDKRTFADFAALPAATANFSYAISDTTASAYTVTATGSGPAAGFVFTIDQNGNKATTAAPSGWTTSTSCWVNRKDGTCAQ